MPRIARGLADNHFYHVLNRGNGRQQIFHNDGDYKAFVDLLIAASERFSVRVYAYCIMPNHFHLLVQPGFGTDLSKCMQWLMTSHVRRYHKYFGTTGHVWQGRYKSFPIQEDNHLLTVTRYIEGNPVRAGFVEAAKGWAWSSHSSRIGKEERNWISGLPIPLPDDWSDFVDTAQTQKELAKLKMSVDRQSPYGETGWQLRISNQFGLSSTLRSVGRPRKK